MLREMLNYGLELFGAQNLKEQYYGYHNAGHELVVTHNTLLVSRGKEFQNTISRDDFKHLFAAFLIVSEESMEMTCFVIMSFIRTSSD